MTKELLKYEQKIFRAADYIRKNLKTIPEFAITFGSGLGGLADKIEIEQIIDYKDIPYFPSLEAVGHEGKLVIGSVNQIPIIGLKGRKHYYEVADFAGGIKHVVFPVHVMAQLGIKNYFVTNAAGGLNLDYNVGDLMIIKSHINRIPSPLSGKILELQALNGRSVERHQPMNDAYDTTLSNLLKQAAVGKIHEGVYLAVPGPEFETISESLDYRKMADAVGMSTTPEVIVAKNRGMKVVGFSCITNIIEESGVNAANDAEVKSILDNPKLKEKIENTVLNFFKLYAQTI